MNALSSAAIRAPELMIGKKHRVTFAQ